MQPIPPGVLVPTGAALYTQLQHLASQYRIVGFAGLPGTGKSLLIQQLAHVAAAGGRTISLLQWDVVRPVFETSPGGQRYPVVDGVTHAVIRKAVGLWARQALLTWHRENSQSLNVCIAETPLIGNRLVELAQVHEDEAESLLRYPICCFVLPMPSVAVRRAIVLRRLQRSSAPLHPREIEDAPPRVLQALWQELYRCAPSLGIAIDTAAQHGNVAYDPDVYCRVYQVVLKHRRCCVLPIDMLLPTIGTSPYQFHVETRDIIPSAEDVSTCIRAVEQQYPETQALVQEVECWYEV